MKSRKRILVDMDGCLVDSLPTWLAEYRMLTGDPLYPEDIKNYGFEQFAEFPKVLFGSLYIGDVFRKAPPMPGAVQGLEFLDKHYDVYIVSYVHGDCPNGHEQKLDWLRHYMPFFNRDKVIFTRNKHLVSGDILIEDNPDNIHAWLKENPRGHEYLIRHPYNVEFEKHYVSVNTLLSVIRDLSNMEAA